MPDHVHADPDKTFLHDADPAKCSRLAHVTGNTYVSKLGKGTVPSTVLNNKALKLYLGRWVPEPTVGTRTGRVHTVRPYITFRKRPF